MYINPMAQLKVYTICVKLFVFFEMVERRRLIKIILLKEISPSNETRHLSHV